MSNSELMSAAYRLLYEIETSLREKIKYSMAYEYGCNLKNDPYNRNLSNIYYHELIPFFAKYEPLLHYFTKKERMELYNLNAIRNKICHMELLTEVDFIDLNNAHRLVISRLKVHSY